MAHFRAAVTYATTRRRHVSVGGTAGRTAVARYLSLSSSLSAPPRRSSLSSVPSLLGDRSGVAAARQRDHVAAPSVSARGGAVGPRPLLGGGQRRSARPVSGVAARFWDMVESKSLNPTNPVLDDVDRLIRLGTVDGGADRAKVDAVQLLPNFSRIRSHHVVDAAEILQAEYDDAWEEFEGELEAFVNGGKEGRLDGDKGDAKDSGEAATGVRSNATGDKNGEQSAASSYEAVVMKLDSITAPLTYLSNVANVLAKFGDDEETKSSLGNIRVNFRRHERSAILGQALKKVEHDLLRDGDDSKESEERIGTVRGLLRDFGHNGMFLDDSARTELDDIEARHNGMFLDDSSKEELDDIEAHLAEAEGTFLDLTSKEAPSSSPKPKECLSLMYEILSLKKERSNVMGYDSYADWSIAPMMAGSVDAVFALHERIAERVLPQVDAEMVAQYEKSLAEAEDLRPYFELENVLGGVFALCNGLFGVDVVEADKDDVRGWHRDVRLFHVYDEASGRHLGSFYLDPFRRMFKYDRNVVSPILHGRKSVSNGAGETVDRKPAVLLSTNIVPPAWDADPVPLTFENVESLFHEFGHVLQHLLPNVESGILSGAHKGPMDASEFISQFVEYWLYEEDILNKFAVHEDTGDPISYEQVHALRERRIAGKKIGLCRHLFRSQLELIINSGASEESLVALQKKLAQHYIPHEFLAKGDLSPLIEVFRHNAAGFHTSCYRYVWSEVMSADAFSAFEEAGALDDPEKMRDLGMKFRESILEAGGTASSGDAYERFGGGREATPDALFEYFDLEAK